MLYLCDYNRAFLEVMSRGKFIHPSNNTHCRLLDNYQWEKLKKICWQNVTLDSYAHPGNKIHASDPHFKICSPAVLVPILSSAPSQPWPGHSETGIHT